MFMWQACNQKRKIKANAKHIETRCEKHMQMHMNPDEHERKLQCYVLSTTHSLQFLES